MQRSSHGPDGPYISNHKPGGIEDPLPRTWGSDSSHDYIGFTGWRSCINWDY